jgi:lipopolysaccharide transport protein LptA
MMVFVSFIGAFLLTASVIWGGYQELVEDLFVFHGIKTTFVKPSRQDLLIQAKHFTFNLDEYTFSGNSDVNVLYKDIYLSSGVFNYNIGDNRLYVHDDVFVKRKEMTITSDHVFLQVPNVLRAKGSVHFSYKAFNAFSNKVLYTVDDRKVTLLGKASLENKDDFVKGEHIELDLNTEKVISRGRSKIKLSTQPQQQDTP